MRSDLLHTSIGERSIIRAEGCDQKYYQCHWMQVQTSDVLELVAVVAHVEIQFEVPCATSIWLDFLQVWTLNPIVSQVSKNFWTNSSCLLTHWSSTTGWRNRVWRPSQFRKSRRNSMWRHGFRPINRKRNVKLSKVSNVQHLNLSQPKTGASDHSQWPT